jgi:hypothetical protein
MFLRDGSKGRAGAAEGQAQNCLAGCPNDARKAEQRRRAEDIIGREHVRLERHLFRREIGGTDGREMHDGIGFLELPERVIANTRGSAQHIDSLPELGQINLQIRADRIRRGGDIGVENAISMIHKLLDNSAASFAAAARNDDILHDTSCSCRVIGKATSPPGADIARLILKVAD